MLKRPHFGTSVKIASSRFIGLAVALAFISFGCARTLVRPDPRVASSKLQPPERIVVNSLKIASSVVTEYQGILRQQPANPDPIAREREIARSVSEAFTAELIHGLRQMGFKVEVAAPASRIEDSDLVIDGQLLKIDEGNPLRRWVIGFGSGASRVETRIAGYRSKSRQKVVEFTTRADSGALPGAVATLPAAAVAPAGVGTGITLGSAAANVANGPPSQIKAMAASSGQQAVRYLTQFFIEQGWLNADHVQRAQNLR